MIVRIKTHFSTTFKTNPEPRGLKPKVPDIMVIFEEFGPRPGL